VAILTILFEPAKFLRIFSLFWLFNVKNYFLIEKSGHPTLIASLKRKKYRQGDKRLVLLLLNKIVHM
jgi:hypothetical protein